MSGWIVGLLHIAAFIAIVIGVETRSRMRHRYEMVYSTIMVSSLVSVLMEVAYMWTRSSTPNETWGPELVQATHRLTWVMHHALCNIFVGICSAFMSLWAKARLRRDISAYLRYTEQR